MIPDPAALERFSRVQSTLRQALELWDGADLESIENSNKVLEESAIHFRDLQDAITLGEVTPTPEVRSAVLDIRNQIHHLTRVVDASSAFIQGLAIYTGTRSSTYDASGRLEGHS